VYTLIEFTHRITVGLSFFAVVGLAAWTFLGTVRGHLARAASVVSVAFMLIEAILGALLVKLGLTAQSQSSLRPVFLALHLVNTLLLLAALALAAHLLGRRKGYLRGSVRLVRPVRTAAGLIVVMIVGVTGSLSALGDTLMPMTSLQLALSQDFSPASSWLVRWRWVHPAVAFMAGIFLIWLVVRAVLGDAQKTARSARQRTGQWDNRGLFALVLLLLAAVYLLGLLNVMLLAPVWTQVAHLLGADLLWVWLVVLTARLTLEPRETK
jgi:cytochrome c oxidase assembly protein subunit 15